MIQLKTGQSNSGSLTPTDIKGQKIDETFYSGIFLQFRSQHTVIDMIQLQLSSMSLPENPQNKKHFNTIMDVIKNILSADFDNLYQRSLDSVQILKLCLAENTVNQMDKIGYSLLYALLSILKIFSRLTYLNSLTGSINEIGQQTFNSDYLNLEKQSTMLQNEYVVCRICEKQVPIAFIDTHSKNCALAFESSQAMCSIDEKLKKLSDDACKTFLQNKSWLSNEKEVVDLILPILHFIMLIKRVISVVSSSPFASEEIDLISDVLISISVSNKEASAILSKVNTMISEKLNTAFNLSKAIYIVRSTSLSRDLEFLNQPTISQFEFLKMISYGAYARVFLCKKISTEDIYAIKVIPKTLLRQKNEVQRTLVERDILLKMNSPYMTKFFFSIIEEHNLYLVMEYLPGGDLFSLLNMVASFDENSSKIYTAQIVMALQFLRENSIIHRDLKPNNILVDSTGHLKLIDFGLSYIGMMDRSITSSETFVGTPGYASPEVVLGQSHTFTADYWALGSILYEFLVGEPPFFGDSPAEIFQNTIKGHYDEENIKEFSPEVQDLIRKLLCLDPSKRIGASSIEEIKNHPWFKGIDWEHIEDISLPFIPELNGKTDTSYFIPPDEDISKEIGEDILDDIKICNNKSSMENEMKQFSSVGLKQLEDKTKRDAKDLRKKKHLSIDVSEEFLQNLEENHASTRRKRRNTPRKSLSPRAFCQANFNSPQNQNCFTTDNNTDLSD